MNVFHCLTADNLNVQFYLHSLHSLYFPRKGWRSILRCSAAWFKHISWDSTFISSDQGSRYSIFPHLKRYHASWSNSKPNNYIFPTSILFLPKFFPHFHMESIFFIFCPELLCTFKDLMTATLKWSWSDTCKLFWKASVLPRGNMLNFRILPSLINSYRK